MNCRHSATCPLLPLLADGFEGWRISYCESDSQWQECERYKRSLAGDPVPSAMLPNGKVMSMMDNGSAEQLSGTSRSSFFAPNTDEVDHFSVVDLATQANSSAEAAGGAPPAAPTGPTEAPESWFRKLGRIFAGRS